MYDLKLCVKSFPPAPISFQLLNQQCMIWNWKKDSLGQRPLSFSCWTSNVWFETSIQGLTLIGITGFSCWTSNVWFETVPRCGLNTSAQSFSCWTSNVWFETDTTQPTPAKAQFQLLNQQCMIWNMSTSLAVRILFLVSVAEPAMYDLKLAVSLAVVHNLRCFSCWTSNVWFETENHGPVARCLVSVAEPAMYDLKP